LWRDIGEAYATDECKEEMDDLKSKLTLLNMESRKPKQVFMSLVSQSKGSVKIEVISHVNCGYKETHSFPPDQTQMGMTTDNDHSEEKTILTKLQDEIQHLREGNQVSDCNLENRAMPMCLITISIREPIFHPT
jgi:hypothetical protein